ncbi:YihY/virulence factor BrkB family protein [Williamwhitmania taraxaci]|uniref:Membrane protein n=1 Tax=Williamwhitmania taraxaci TaxID=1640674 RepID=A0A1G6U551_9BACT|nr:YihY/virulence factor BrkB family protein [Williamwhitmania taraxaci]SDD36423.1 membrane protein [Williamwhitmania taraxaci]
MKKSIFSTIFTLLKTTFKKWWDRDPFSQSEIVAYNAIFSLPGLLVVVLAIAGYFFGGDAVSGKLHSEVSQTMGTDTADQIEKMVLIANKSKDSIWATLLGIAILIFGATRVFVQFQKSFNTIWDVKASPTSSGIWSFVKTRIFSFGLIVSIAFLLLISLLISSLLSAFSSWVVQNWSESLLIVFKMLSLVFSVGIIAVLFALMFKYLPDTKIKWSTVWIGAFITSLLFAIGKSGLALYFGKADPSSGYGAAGSIILILLWTSYSSMIVFFGAEFTKVYSDFIHGRLSASTKVAKADTQDDKKGQKNGLGK